MLEMFKNTKIVHKKKFIFACILWLLVTILFGVIIAWTILLLIAAMAVGLFAYWQLDAPKTKNGDDLIGLLVVVGSPLFSFLLGGFLRALLKGTVSEFLFDACVGLATLGFCVAVGVGGAYMAQRHKDAPKLSEDLWRKRLRHAKILKSNAKDAWIMAVPVVIIYVVFAVHIGLEDFDKANPIIVLAGVDAIGGLFLFCAGVLKEKNISANFAGASERGERLSEEERSYLQWEIDRTESAREAKLGMDMAKVTPGVPDDLLAAQAGLSKLPDWKSEKGPFLLRHLTLFLNLLVLGVVFYLAG